MSPGFSNFALKATADDNEAEIDSAAAECLQRYFYVNDGLKSVLSTIQAADLVKDIKEMCKRGGYNLHKFASDQREVVEQNPVCDETEGIKQLDSSCEALLMECALGVQWCIESDTFSIHLGSQFQYY